jgi:hypothetical protein
MLYVSSHGDPTCRSFRAVLASVQEALNGSFLVGLYLVTLESRFAKRDLIAQIWEETRYDEKEREFLFDTVIEDMEAYGKELAEAREDEIRGEVRSDIREEWRDDPPDDLRASVIKGLLTYPPMKREAGHEHWKELRKQFKDDARSEVEDEMGDLRLEIEQLKDEIAQLRGVSRDPARKPGKVWR